MIGADTKEAGWTVRGVMLDPARLTESYAYYRALIPSLADWGYNTILLHLTGDQGCAVLLEAPRELGASAAARVCAGHRRKHHDRR